MEEEDAFDPKELEILPVRLVQMALQRGLLSDAAFAAGEQLGDKGSAKAATKYALKNRRFGRDALATANRAASLFVLYVVSIAQDIARSKKRATVYDKDVLEALKQGLFWEIEREMSDDMAAVQAEMRSRQLKIMGQVKERAAAGAVDDETAAREPGDEAPEDGMPDELEAPVEGRYDPMDELDDEEVEDYGDADYDPDGLMDQDDDAGPGETRPDGDGDDDHDMET